MPSYSMNTASASIANTGAGPIEQTTLRLVLAEHDKELTQRVEVLAALLDHCLKLTEDLGTPPIKACTDENAGRREYPVALVDTVHQMLFAKQVALMGLTARAEQLAARLAWL